MLKHHHIDAETFDEIEAKQTEFATKYGCMVVLYWDGFQLAFTPEKQNKDQLVLDGFEMPKFTEFMEPGE